MTALSLGLYGVMAVGAAILLIRMDNRFMRLLVATIAVAGIYFNEEIVGLIEAAVNSLMEFFLMAAAWIMLAAILVGTVRWLFRF